MNNYTFHNYCFTYNDRGGKLIQYYINALYNYKKNLVKKKSYTMNAEIDLYDFLQRLFHH